MSVWRSVPGPVIHRFAAPLIFADAKAFRDHVLRLPIEQYEHQAVRRG